MSDPILALTVGVFVLGVVLLVGFTRRATIVPVTMAAKLDDVVERVRTNEEDLKKTKHDITNLRHMVNHLPTNQSINELKLEVVESRGQITGMQSTLSANSHSLERIEDFLLRAGSDAIANGREQRLSRINHEQQQLRQDDR